MKKKVVGIVVGLVVVAAVAAGGIWYFFGRDNTGSGKDKVYVQSVAEIVGRNNGFISSYNGVVESQETLKVNCDQERKVKDILVSVGDTVEEGTALFTYDTEDATNQIASIKLDIESINNDIESYNSQITELTKEKEALPADQQFEYTTQIQTLQTQIKQAQYDIKGKQAEIEKQQKLINNSTVTSSIAGVVKTIAENGNGGSSDGAQDSFMTILATGDYRVKGSIDEQNVYNLSVGQAVVVRSRVDETMTWTGTISAIDTESKIENNNDIYENEGVEQATKYPFYISLDSTDNLLLGQHLFIEPDYGQTEVMEGLWLDSSYICYEEDGSAYVWAANSRNRLEKRTIEVGKTNDERYVTEILSGLTEEDLIAWPMDGLYEGVATVTSYEEIDYTAPLYQQENDGLDDMEGVNDMDSIEDMGYGTESLEELGTEMGDAMNQDSMDGTENMGVKE